MNQEEISQVKLQGEFREKYGYELDMGMYNSAIYVFQGKFVSKENEYKKYSHINILEYKADSTLQRISSFANSLSHLEFKTQINDMIEVGLRRFHDKYLTGQTEVSPFVLYEKYSRRDISLLMNCGKDLSSIMYGMKRIGEDVFIFVTYHKEECKDDEKNYLEGKPDYADIFEDNLVFRWDSQMGRGINSSYVQDVIEARNKHLFVKKSDAETSFYYMGQFDVTNVKPALKKDNSGKKRDIAKIRMKMHRAVRDDILRYLQSSIVKKEVKVQ